MLFAILIISLIVLSIVLVGCKKIGITGNSAADVTKESNCQDSDGGIDKDVKGIVTIAENTYVDFCANGILVEYYCDGDKAANQNVKCPNKCSNGKCI